MKIYKKCLLLYRDDLLPDQKNKPITSLKLWNFRKPPGDEGDELNRSINESELIIFIDNDKLKSKILKDETIPV